MTEPSRLVRPGYRLLVLPCRHCFNCYCYCLVQPDDVKAAQGNVDYRHRMSLKRAAIGRPPIQQAA